MPTLRHILHVDLDAFYAAVEQMDRPELRGQPVLVGGSATGRGVLSTASYEARVFGCRSAMPTGVAMRLCPQAILIPPRMGRYLEVSRQVFDVVERFSPLIEPLSIDEAFVDLTGSIRLFGPADGIARRMKDEIKRKTGMTASVGLAPNKFVAKLASDVRKPDGLVIVPDDGVQEFLDPLPISRLWGVGKMTLLKFEDMGIATFGDVRRLPLTDLRASFGDSGERFYHLVRGEDDRAVIPDRDAKSISHETTFAEDIADHEHLRSVILGQTDAVAARLRKYGRLARTVGLKIRSGDFSTITRRATLNPATDRTDQFWTAASALFDEWSRTRPPAVRLIGVGLSGLTSGAERQLSLFDAEEDERKRRLDHTVDEIRSRYGKSAVKLGGARSDDGSN